MPFQINCAYISTLIKMREIERERENGERGEERQRVRERHKDIYTHVEKKIHIVFEQLNFQLGEIRNMLPFVILLNSFKKRELSLLSKV